MKKIQVLRVLINRGSDKHSDFSFFNSFVTSFLKSLVIGLLLVQSLNAYAKKENGRSWKLIREGVYSIKVSDVIMEIDANHGARIISLRLRDQEILTNNKVNAENYGSTFWLSPETWKWPPSPVLDAEPYKAVAKRNKLTLISGDYTKSGCKMLKTIVTNDSDNSFSIDYVITKISSNKKSVAPWDVTRVPAGGLTFFPIWTPGGYSKSNLITEDLNGICWFKYDRDLVTNHQKLFRNGAEGWLAHINNKLLFIKQFEDIGIEEEAPKETEIEIYANKDKTYIELENQGAYKTLRPGESLSWNVKWFLLPVPSNIQVKQGNMDLAGLVRTTLSINKN